MSSNENRNDDSDDDFELPEHLRGGMPLDFNPTTEEQEDEEDLTSRSMATMMAPSPALNFGPPSSLTSGTTGIDHPSFASYSVPEAKKMPQELQIQGPISSLDVARSMGWNATDKTVPTKPEFHPLERTAVFVPHTSADVVTDRVCRVLRDRSIDVLAFDDIKAKAKCVTQDNVDFRIRLYRGRNQYNHGIIVEVQRRYGFSINFHADTSAILDAAEGKSVSSTPPANQVPVVSDIEDDETNEDVGSSSLKIASILLDVNRSMDEHRLGLQTLASVTDNAKMGQNTSSKVSKKLLLEEQNDIVRTAVWSIVLKDSNLLQDPEEMYEMRTLAMTVMANVLSNVTGDVLRTMGPSLDVLIATLTQDLVNASSQARMAHLAARCIEPLIRSGIRGESEAKLLNAIEAAHSVGQARHAGLSDQAERCLTVFN